MASWGEGNLVTVQDGVVVDASSPSAQRAAQRALDAGAVRVWEMGPEGDDSIMDSSRTYEPGQPGFVKAALGRLPYAIITGDD